MYGCVFQVVCSVQMSLLVYTFLVSLMPDVCPSHLIHLCLGTIIIFGEGYKLWNSAVGSLSPAICPFLSGRNIIPSNLFSNNPNPHCLFVESTAVLICIFIYISLSWFSQPLKTVLRELSREHLIEHLGVSLVMQRLLVATRIHIHTAVD
jgi:hypothetical protein